ncbi:MAG: HAD family hydrolase [Pirellulales bacterium]
MDSALPPELGSAQAAAAVLAAPIKRVCGDVFETAAPHAPTGSLASPAPRLHVDGLMIDTADVLYDATRWPRRLQRLLAGLGLTVSYAQMVADWEHNYLADVHCGRREYDEAFGAFLLAAGLSWAQIDEVEAASRIERQSLELGVRPLPGVVTTCKKLQASSLPMIAWADSAQPADKVAQRLIRLGLGGCFRAVLSSLELEAAQPSPRCYQAALEVLALPAGRMAYVGHDTLHLAAARACGLATVGFNHAPDAAADFYLTGFDQLLALLELA